MLLPFMNISSFLHNFEDIGKQLHEKISKYFLKMMHYLREQMISGDADASEQAASQLQFHEENLVEFFDRTLHYSTTSSKIVPQVDSQPL